MGFSLLTSIQSLNCKWCYRSWNRSSDQHLWAWSFSAWRKDGRSVHMKFYIIISVWSGKCLYRAGPQEANLGAMSPALFSGYQEKPAAPEGRLDTFAKLINVVLKNLGLILVVVNWRCLAGKHWEVLLVLTFSLMSARSSRARIPHFCSFCVFYSLVLMFVKVSWRKAAIIPFIVWRTSRTCDV